MTPQDCPLPEVADALGPFIKPRDEVARIRQELQAYLRKQTQFDDVPLTAVNLAGPHEDAPLQPSSSLSGVRKAYLQALRAHATAQAKYDALKTDINRLSAPPLEANNAAKASSSTSDNYIPLLRQREKQRKLQAIERALSGITAAGNDATSGHIDDIVRQRAGDLPTPPTAQPPAFGEKPDIDARLLQLKKAVLVTKRRVDMSNVSVPESKGHARSGPKAEIAGLQSALSELTGWMEQQLAIIGDAENGNQSAPPTPMRNGHAALESARIEDIEATYEQYLEARQRLIETVNNPPAPDVELDVDALASAQAAKCDDKRITSAEVLLPHIHILASTKQEEQSLLQQSAYLRRQISTAEAENHRLIARLADESHLVQPGASKGRDWAEAASEASKATEEFAKQRLQAGEASADAAKRALESIGHVPEMLDASSADARAM